MTFRRVSAACAVTAACTIGAARADSLALELGRKAYALWTAAQEDEVRARMRALEQRADQLFLASELLLATDPIEAAQVDVSATVGGGFDVSHAASEASAQLTAHLDSATCQALWASLLLRGRTSTSLDDRARASGEAAAGACFPNGILLDDLFDLPLPLSAFPLRVEGHAALSKTPSLTASRSALREPYSEAGWRVAIEGARYLYGDRQRWIASPGISAAQNWQWLGFPTGDAARLEVVLDAWFVRFHRRRPPAALADRSIDIFAFAAHGIRDDNGASVIDVWPLRISGLGTDLLLVDLALGGSGVGTLTANDEQIPTTGLPQVDIAAVHAALHLGDQLGSLSIGYDRRLDTNLLAELVHEDRAWLTTRRAQGQLRFDATAFGGRAIHYFDASTRGAERLLGASLDASFAFHAHLAVGLALGATHTLSRDATLDDRVAPNGVRALLTLTATHTLYQGQLIPMRSLRPSFVPPRPSAPAP